jgi:hypothetical protein
MTGSAVPRPVFSFQILSPPVPACEHSANFGPERRGFSATNQTDNLTEGFGFGMRSMTVKNEHTVRLSEVCFKFLMSA